MKKRLRVYLSVILVIAMLLTSSRLTRATEGFREDISSQEEQIIEEKENEKVENEQAENETEQTTDETTIEATEEATSESIITKQETDIQEENEPTEIEERNLEEDLAEENNTLICESEEYIVTVRPREEGVLSEGTRVSVTPILNSDETEVKYAEVERKLWEKAEGENYQIAGFLAYDITLFDREGNKIEPDGKVEVSIEYKKASLPEGIDTENVQNMDVTVMHLEENAKGEVKNVADLSEQEGSGSISNLETNEAKEVEKIEFQTESFSTYVVTWTNQNPNRAVTLNLHYVDSEGKEIADSVNITGRPAQNNGPNGSSIDLGRFTGNAQNTVTVSGYTYANQKYVYTSANTKTTFTNLKLNSNTSGGTTNYTIYADNTYIKNLTYSSTNRRYEAELDVYLVYNKNRYTVHFKKNDPADSSSTADLYTLTFTEDDMITSDGKKSVVVDLSNKITSSKDPTNYVFYGWSQSRSANTSTSQKVYSGSEDIKITYGTKEKVAYTYDETKTWVIPISSFDSNRSLNLYATYAVASSKGNSDISKVGNKNQVDFFVRLDGKSPNEPGSFPTSAYTSRISGDSNSLYYYQHIYNNVDAVMANVKTFPSESEIAEKVNSAINSGNKAYLDADKKERVKAYNNDTMYVEWYVLKKESDSWHFDGVLRSRQKWTLRYDANTTDTVANIIAGEQYNYDENATVYNTSINGKKSATEPVRNGYTFQGWNTKADGSGISFVCSNLITVNEETGKIYYNGVMTDEVATKNSEGSYVATLYAQWKSSYVEDIVTPSQLSHEKYIKANSDGTYDLTLNVSGTVGNKNDKAQMDVLVLVDHSKNQTEDKLSAMKSAMHTFVSTMNDKAETIDTRWKVLTYDANVTDISSGWVNGVSVQAQVNALSASQTGESNYQKALAQIDTTLDSGREGAIKVVIFMSAGQPTVCNTYTMGSGKLRETTYNNSVNEAKNIMKSTQFYALGFGIDDISIYNDNQNTVQQTMTGQTFLNTLTNNVTKSTRIAVNKTSNELADMQNAVESIARNLTRASYHHVTIMDTLSEYAEMTENSNFTIKILKNTADSQGKISQSEVGRATGRVKDGATYALEDTGNITATYDTTNKTITLALPENYILQDGYTYAVTFEVQPTEKAYLKYGNDGKYPSTGDSDTDAPDNSPITSSGKAGFYSNQQANVSYKKDIFYADEVRETVDGSEAYKKPVLQVDYETTSKTVNKVWEKGTPRETVEMELKATAEETLLTNYSLLPTNVTQSISESNNWEYTWSNLPSYYYYVDDNGYTQKTAITYDINENLTAAQKKKFSGTKETSGDTITITNTRQISIDLKKIGSSDSKELEGAKFKLTKGTKTSGANTITWSGNATDIEASASDTGELAGLNGYYKLEETKAPAGFSLLEATIYFKIDQNTKTVILTDKNGNRIGNQQEMWSLSTEDGFVLTVKNTALYELPQSGGRGIYIYTLGGMACMLSAAALLMLTLRKKENR